jgi:HD-like signal output (HDOD) protein
MEPKPKPIDKNLLAGFLKPYDITPEGFMELAEKSNLESILPGRPLFTRGQYDHWVFFLVEGNVELQAKDGVTTITGGTEKALLPLAPGTPRRATVVAKSPIQIIRINSELLELLTSPETSDGYIVEEINNVDTDVESRLLYQVYLDFVNDAIVLPSMPEIALRVRKVIDDEDHCNVFDVTKIIQSDPALTARIIQVANSAFYKGESPVSDCRNAIMRLGLSVTRNLVLSFTLKQLFQSKSSLLQKRMVSLWQHSSYVAVLSYVLAGKTAGVDSDRAMLAGLVHDIGVLLILDHADKYPELVTDDGALERVIQKFRGQFGAMVLRKWNFASDLVSAALEAENWYRDPESRADYCDVVLIAQLHSFIGSKQMHACPHMDSLPAFKKLAVGKLTPNKCLEILEEAKEDIQELKQLLFG